MNKKHYAFSLLLLSALAVRSEDALPVKVVHPRRGEIARTISLPATVAANQQATLYAKVGGYLKTIHVDKGDAVKQGDLLAEIEVPELLADRARAKAEMEIAELDFKRAENAQQKAPDLLPAQTVDAARARKLIARATLDRAETLLSFTRIIAPFNGFITRRSVDPGAFIPAATSGGTTPSSALLVIADFESVRIQVPTPEPEVPLMREGLPVLVRLDELPRSVFTGSVTRTSLVLDETTRTMLAEVDLPNPEHQLRPGMFATAIIAIEKHADALLLPVNAVLFEKIGPSVFLAVGGKARKTTIATGFKDGTSVEVLGSGISTTDPVILPGRIALANGRLITITTP